MDTAKKDRILFGAAFFITFVMVIVIYAAVGIAPFGDRTLVISDSNT